MSESETKILLLKNENVLAFPAEVFQTSRPDSKIRFSKIGPFSTTSPGPALLQRRPSFVRAKRKNEKIRNFFLLFFSLFFLIFFAFFVLEFFSKTNSAIEKINHFWNLIQNGTFAVTGVVSQRSPGKIVNRLPEKNTASASATSAFATSASTTSSAPSASAAAATRQLPQAIIIGVKKGGTRALLEYIRMHPQVRAPGSEMHFFDRHYQRGIDWYRNQMPLTSPSQMTIEKTPSYFVTRDVPNRVFKMNPKIKLIIVVRDPVTRAISDYTQALSKGRSTRSFSEMAFYSNGTHRLLDTSWTALRIGLYAQHLEKWLRYFPLEQMLFISGEQLIHNPAGQMDRVQDFLGVEKFIRPRHFYFDQTKGFPCVRRPEMQLRKCLGKSKGRQHPTIAPDVIAQLRDFYQPFNEKFYAMVGENFHWL